MPTIALEWIKVAFMIFFLKNLLKKFAVSEKSLTFATAFREVHLT